jgi:transketolase
LTRRSTVGILPPPSKARAVWPRWRATESTRDPMPDKSATARAADALPVTHNDMANAIRSLAMDAVQQADSGHPGMPMGMADVATVLFTRFLKFDPATPRWPDRDRFVLSAGHGSMLLYALLHLTGYADMTLDEIKRFRQLGSKTAGHPEYGHASGIETTTGPLGQGLGNAVGMALAERALAARFGGDIVDHYTYAVAGDGCLMEGVGQEAVTLAGHLGLGRLIVLFDDNGISIDGPTSLSTSEDHLMRFAAANWHVSRVDGHDPAEIEAAIRHARTIADRPSLIACRTTIGYGAPTKAGTAATHGSPLGKDEVAGARAKLGWPHAPFELPAAILAAWRATGKPGAALRLAWEKRLAALPGTDREEWNRRQSGALPATLSPALATFKARVAAEKPSWATRKASQEVLEVINPLLPDTIGGSADLTGSNNTKTATTAPIRRGAFEGRYVYYGIREHAMAAAMNGMALHGGIIPYGGTFLVFTDYCRPAIRLSALMGQRVIYVMTHDSIGLGEDGPTHQPVEHLAALRAIPGLVVFRPADAIETAECWELALAARNHPSVLALTRQNLPTLRGAGDANLCARGAYIVAGAAADRVRLIASGSEVQLAIEARAALAKDGIAAAVVSMPSWELFAAQDAAWRAEVMGGAGTVRVACEAATGFGWERWLGADGAFVGMTGFGGSAKYQDLYRHFGITAEAIADAARRRVRG